jgi:signal transduction histidine kinase
VPKYVESDPVRLQQVVSNLMSNATKFADDFSIIVITCSFDNDELHISVENDGIVIEDEEKRDLFKRYKTLKAAQMIGAAGSGLGLYISRSLCQAMGGDIVLHNKVSGHGVQEVGHNAFIATVKVKPLPDQEESF